MPSGSGQTPWVVETLREKTNGVFVDIGCRGPLYINNTDYLELKLGWWGMSLDIDEKALAEWQGVRNTDHLVHADATKQDYSCLFSEHNLPNVIDYLSIDLEPPPRTFEVLKMLPFHDYKFRLITFEHDDYRNEFKSHHLRRRANDFLTSKGYVKVPDNIVDSFHPTGLVQSVSEDWYYHPELLSHRDIIPNPLSNEEQLQKYKEKA